MKNRTSISLDAESEIDMEREFSSIGEMTEAIEDMLQDEGVEFDVEYTQEQGARGGAVEFLTASTTLLTALTPIIVAFFESRGKKVERTRAKMPDGTVIETVKVTTGGG